MDGMIAQEDWMRLKQRIQHDRSAIASGIALAAFMGLRLGEICALQGKDVQGDSKQLFVRHTVQRHRSQGGTRKTKLLVRPIKEKSPLVESAMEAVR